MKNVFLLQKKGSSGNFGKEGMADDMSFFVILDSGSVPLASFIT